MGKALHGAGFEQQVGVITAPPCSIACWISILAASAEGRMIGVGSSNASFGSVMGVQYNTSTLVYNLVARNDAGTADLTAVNPVVCQRDSSWHHVVAIFTRDNSRTIYVDGSNPITSIFPISVTPSSIDRTALGGYYQNGSKAGTGLNGSMAYPAFWSVALTPTDVANLYAGMSPKYVQTPSLQAYTRFSGPGSANESDYILTAQWSYSGYGQPITNPIIYGF